jgi:hypothetical protein
MNHGDAKRAYLERLQSIRRREEQHLSAADFKLFIKRFDQLIRRVEIEVQALESTSNPLIQAYPNGVLLAPDARTIHYLIIDGASTPSCLAHQTSGSQSLIGAYFNCLTSVVQRHDNRPSRIESAQIRSMNAEEPFQRSVIQRSVLCPQAA